ncbi:MAG: DHH family phosphoesterase, partial [Candidatus Pacearchaeota archaeon]
EIIKNKLINYYNPIFSNNPTNEPTSFISYEITKRREDMWLAMAGCIGDNFLPNFSDEFSKKYPEIWKKDAKSAFEILYESELGKLILILDFALKDKTSNVVAMMNFLFNVKFPNDILIENEHNLKIISRYKSVNKVYQKLIERAKKVARTHKKIVFFHYGGDISLSANLANELSFRFPGKTILIAYIKGEIANISIRGGGDIRKTTLKAIKRIPTASGGGHKNATGAKMRASSLKDFVKIFEDEFEK